MQLHHSVIKTSWRLHGSTRPGHSNKAGHGAENEPCCQLCASCLPLYCNKNEPPTAQKMHFPHYPALTKDSSTMCCLNTLIGKKRSGKIRRNQQTLTTGVYTWPQVTPTTLNDCHDNNGLNRPTPHLDNNDLND